MTLLADFFQFGYVTSDLDAAMALYRDRLDVPAFWTFETAPERPHRARIGLAWKGDVMIELIQPMGHDHPLYGGLLPEEGFAIRLHHLGHLCPDEGAWEKVEQTLAAQGVPIVSRGGPPGRLECLYADGRPQLGHYLEYVILRGDKDFFAPCPGR